MAPNLLSHVLAYALKSDANNLPHVNTQNSTPEYKKVMNFQNFWFPDKNDEDTKNKLELLIVRNYISHE